MHPRFPRLRTSTSELKRLETILWITYNKIHRSRRLDRFQYDIYKSKKGKYVKHCFTVLADILAQDHIDPSLYLKVLCKYGAYENSKYLPNPKWLMSKKALDIFDWKLEAERSKFVRAQDWTRHLNDPGIENSRHARKGIRRSWQQVNQLAETWQLDIGSAALFLADRLSPWFLAICISFQRLGGLDALAEKDRRMVEKCMRHLIMDRRAYREALDAYSKGE